MKKSILFAVTLFTFMSFSSCTDQGEDEFLLDTIQVYLEDEETIKGKEEGLPPTSGKTEGEDGEIEEPEDEEEDEFSSSENKKSRTQGEDV